MGTGKKEICKKLNGRWNKEQVSCVMKVPVFFECKNTDFEKTVQYFAKYVEGIWTSVCAKAVV